MNEAQWKRVWENLWRWFMRQPVEKLGYGPEFRMIQRLVNAELRKAKKGKAK